MDRFGEALNLAAGRVLGEEGISVSVSRSGIEDGADAAGSEQELLIGSSSSSAALPSPQLNRQQRGAKSGPYTLVRARNVGMTAILLYAREPERVRKVEGAECGFGTAEMGNKGAVGLRVTWDSSSGSETERGTGKMTELTFVAAHLAAMEWNVHKRNADWRAIVEGLIFGDPKDLLSSALAEGPSSTEEEDPSSDTAPLLPVSNPNTSQQLAKLHSHTIYSPTSYFFIAGDLNYRISSTAPAPDDIFPPVTPTPEDPHYSQFFARDQLTQERLAGRTLHGLSEAEVKFPPTYKVVVTNPDSPQGRGEEEVSWRFARHRWPAWCDRVLWLDVPPWVNSSRDKTKIVTKAYDALPVVRTSDHRAVFWRGEVPLLSVEEMAPPPSPPPSPPPPPPSSLATASTSPAAEGVRNRGIGHHEQHQKWEDDPRVKLPFAVDVHAWERRAAARQRELVVGLTALLWSTREGALVLSTMVALGLGAWWLVGG